MHFYNQMDQKIEYSSMYILGYYQKANIKGWVAIVFCIAHTHLARPDLRLHAQVRALQIFGGRTTHPNISSAHFFLIVDF